MILDNNGPSEQIDFAYATRYFVEPIPTHQLPAEGMPADAAYELIHNELNLDGNPALNLATFVTTWMEPQARALVDENLHRNYIDHDEYPQTSIIEQRVVKILGDLYHAPDPNRVTGTRTIGSSEGVMLAGLALKWKWRKRREAAGLSTDKPNLIFGADVHVVWDKLCRYFDIEPRIIPLEWGKYTTTVEEVAKRIDENTIGVGAILGTTYTGESDPIEDLNSLLLQVKEEKGWDIPIHVDAASGGFVTPFVYPQHKWDFRLEQVHSINVSGHKFGLVFPGIGWLIFRDETKLPEDLIFYCDYLGDVMPTYTLNFSQGSAMMIAQYYNLIRLGRSGYERIMKNMVSNAEYLADRIAESGKFEMITPSLRLPLITFRLKDQTQPFNEFDLSAKLREQRWIVPAYTLPENVQNVRILRVVVREQFSRNLADRFVTHLEEAYAALTSRATGVVSAAKQEGFAKPIC